MTYLWIIFALLSAVTAALVAIFAKVGLQNIDTNTATAIRAVIMALFLVMVVAIQGKFGKISEIFSDNRAVIYIVLSGIAGALSWLFYFLAIKMGDVSKVVPIDRLSIVFAIIFAFLLLGETISLQAIIGVIVMVVGAILIALG